MKSDRYNRGLQKLIEMEGDVGRNVITMMDAISPEFTQYLVEFVFGDIYSRKGLDLKTKEIITVASMATLGTVPLQVKVHIHAAMNLGCSEQDIIEILLQLIPSCGMAVPMNALLIAKEVFEERRNGEKSS
ncbi:MAG: carboxymuconolactone decarboxylase family protein [Solidesulfovibrio sp.]